MVGLKTKKYNVPVYVLYVYRFLIGITGFFCKMC